MLEAYWFDPYPTFREYLKERCGMYINYFDVPSDYELEQMYPDLYRKFLIAKKLREI